MIAIRPLPPPTSPEYSSLVDRRPNSDQVRQEVGALLASVRARGDDAVRELTERFDGVRLEHSAVRHSELLRALRSLPPELVGWLRAAVDQITAVHSAQRFAEEQVEVVRGVRVWRAWRPLQRVGVYVPGGRTPYPSSVLMLCVPAHLAGCSEVVLCSPPGPDGKLAAPILAAAALAGTTEVHAIGGVQAIGAMAYGTQSLRRVDKIFGPGNAYVTAAKQLVFGEVAVDMPAGPSEIVVVTDGSVPAQWLAADLCAQAEHSPDALGILVSTDSTVAEKVAAVLDTRYAPQVRILVASEIPAALNFANDFSPEHLTLACRSPQRWLARVRNAGSVFLGAHGPAAAGDYATGANHVLPTGGAARAFSGLGLDAFGHTIQVQSLTPGGLASIAPIVENLSAAERFDGHWESVRVRLSKPSRNAPAAPSPRRDVLQMHPYIWEASTPEVAARAAISPDQVIRFDTNSSPWAGAGVGDLTDLAVNEYPDATYPELTAALQRYVGVGGASLTVGAGADEVLDLVVKAYVGRGDPVLVSDPSYSMFTTLTEMAGGRPIAVPAVDLALDRDRMLEAAKHARLIWLCSPNNPTGELLPTGYVAEVAQATAGVVVVDEAYHEFCGISAASLVRQLPNLVVVRTLSKAFGLAGVRVGYAVSGSQIAVALARVRPPGSISVLSAALAVRALGRVDQMRERIATLSSLQQTLARSLAEMGLEVLTPPVNFVLATCPDELASRLAHHGLVVRTFAAGSPLKGWMRITVRSEVENQRLIAAVCAWRETNVR